MDENKAALGVKELISTNSAALVAGLTHPDGHAREIKQLTSSILTPPELFYFIAVHVSGAEMSYDSIRRGVNIGHDAKSAMPGLVEDTYDTKLYVMDYFYYASEVGSSTESFEEEHALFRQLTDNIVNLLDQTDSWTYDGYTMRIPGERGYEDRRIRKENRVDFWENQDGTFYRAITEIGFTVRACGDTT